MNRLVVTVGFLLIVASVAWAALPSTMTEIWNAIYDSTNSAINVKSYPIKYTAIDAYTSQLTANTAKTFTVDTGDVLLIRNLGTGNAYYNFNGAATVSVDLPCIAGGQQEYVYIQDGTVSFYSTGTPVISVISYKY